MDREHFDYLLLGLGLAAILSAIIYACFNTRERKYRRYERREDKKAGTARKKRN